MNNNGSFSLLIFALPLLLLGWLFFTQNKRMKQMRNFSSSLDVGDRIVTSSGIYGVVTHLDDSTAWSAKESVAKTASAWLKTCPVETRIGITALL